LGYLERFGVALASGEPLIGTASLPFRDGLWHLRFLQWLLARRARSALGICLSLFGAEGPDLDPSRFLLTRFQIRPGYAN